MKIQCMSTMHYMNIIEDDGENYNVSPGKTILIPQTMRRNCKLFSTLKITSKKNQIIYDVEETDTKGTGNGTSFHTT